jgi:hypothetical protein
MNNTFEIKSKLKDSAGHPLVIDVATAPGQSVPALGASVDVTERNGDTRQLWQAIESAPHPGYFRIQSLQHDDEGKNLVIDIRGVNKTSTMTDGTLLDAYTNDAGFDENQLWTIALDPNTRPNTSLGPVVEQQDYVFIQSYLKNSSGTPYVIDIFGWESGPGPSGGSRLDAFHQKDRSTENQLWRLEAQTGPFAEKIKALVATSPSGFVSVEGTGFLAGATLALVGTFDDGTGNIAQASPILAVTDFAGSFVASAAISKWALSEALAGDFAVSVFYNDTGIFNPSPAASWAAYWNGEYFSEA